MALHRDDPSSEVLCHPEYYKIMWTFTPLPEVEAMPGKPGKRPYETSRPWPDERPFEDLRSGEQVADRPHSEGVEPAPPAMFGGVMAHMAALTERREVAWPVVAGIMVQVRAGEHDARDPHWSWRFDAG